MKIYICKRCGYETEKKCNYRKHIYIKNVCKVTKEDIPIDVLRKELEDERNVQPEKTYNCDHCESKFQSRQGLWKHKKKHEPKASNML